MAADLTGSRGAVNWSWLSRLCRLGLAPEWNRRPLDSATVQESGQQSQMFLCLSVCLSLCIFSGQTSAGPGIGWVRKSRSWLPVDPERTSTEYSSPENFCADQPRKCKEQAVWCLQDIIPVSVSLAPKRFRISSNLISHVSLTEIFFLTLD